MNKLNTASVSLAVTPTVVSTLFSHYLNRKPLKERPTAHLSYDEGLHLIRSFLNFASHHTVEEVQAFTAQWVPNPQWIKVDDDKVPESHLTRSAELIQAQLGPDGIQQVGGREWWQWRKPRSTLEAEWIEMRSHNHARKKIADPGRRVMLYLHGGGYYFGSVDEHRYQMQRHARKLKARVFAPRYRLAPQFPFPCGLQDCLAAYLYLLSSQDPSTIVIAGDSAGGGMALSLLCILRDQGIPLPAGAILISPWVDLTHSFPSVSGDAPYDYIPQAGFHHKPSRAWPPPNDDDIAMLKDEATKRVNGQGRKRSDTEHLEQKQQAPGPETGVSVDTEVSKDAPGYDNDKYLKVKIDGEVVTIKDQIQMYASNAILAHPLVSPVLQPTLGGLPPLLVMVGGGEILRDEQIFLAHKCANPTKYAPPAEKLSDKDRELLQKYKPTDVQLQVWDDLCHVAPTLSFTRPAKLMYRSIAQFGAWALARAQKMGIDILDDDDISVISSSGSDAQANGDEQRRDSEREAIQQAEPGQVGKAGDPLPHFKKHMIRQRVTRHGVTLPLAPESELPSCCMDVSDVGVVKEKTVKKWLAARQQWDQKYASAKSKVQKQIISDIATGFESFGPDEHPPVSALAGRRRIKADMVEKKKKKSIGLALWSLWGSKHDEMTVEREKDADKKPDTQEVTGDESRGARPFPDIEAQPGSSVAAAGVANRSRSRSRTVVDEHQTDEEGLNENTPVAQLIEQRKEQEAEHPGLLSPNYVPETGVAGKRPFIDGIALPFSLKKEAETASMMTLDSAVTPMNPSKAMSPADSRLDVSGQPAAEDEARAEQMLAASGVDRAPADTFATTHAAIPQIKEPHENGNAA